MTTSPPAELDPAVWTGLLRVVADGGLCVLSGAGLSTESGIPGYRGPDGERRVTPMTAGELLASPQARRRYWARAYVGWPRFAAAAPNAGHQAVARLERHGLVESVITQNVDGLHQRAGAERVAELHGSLAHVVCVDCGETYARDVVDGWLAEANPGFDRDSIRGRIRPDGDVVLSDAQVARFHTIACVVCRSDRLKPDVVMFGESVAKPLVQECYAAVAAASCLLVLGSSLMVMSGYRFVRYAAREGIPVVVVTQGVTRAAAETMLKVDAPLGATLTRLSDALTA